MRIKGSWGEFEAPYVIAFLISDELGIREREKIRVPVLGNWMEITQDRLITRVKL